jgi:hypothetical protein
MKERERRKKEKRKKGEGKKEGREGVWEGGNKEERKRKKISKQLVHTQP